MKKKLMIIATAVTLVALISIGGTLALLTNQAEITNQITMGNVSIRLEEPIFSSTEISSQAGDGIYVKKDLIYPGSSFVKDPTIINSGNNPCYVRAKVDLVMKKKGDIIPNNTVEKANGDKLTVNPEDFFQANDGWARSGDGYYYYKAILPRDGKVTLFRDNMVKVPTQWGNEIADIEFSLNVSAQAIQSENFTPTIDGAGNITAWQYKDGTAVPISAVSS
jgi:predicted ribosomally synthesized peptide with SipW-like signal peptide